MNLFATGIFIACSLLHSGDPLDSSLAYETRSFKHDSLMIEREIAEQKRAVIGAETYHTFAWLHLNKVLYYYEAVRSGSILPANRHGEPHVYPDTTHYGFLRIDEDADIYLRPRTLTKKQVRVLAAEERSKLFDLYDRRASLVRSHEQFKADISAERQARASQ